MSPQGQVLLLLPLLAGCAAAPPALRPFSYADLDLDTRDEKVAAACVENWSAKSLQRARAQVFDVLGRASRPGVRFGLRDGSTRRPATYSYALIVEDDVISSVTGWLGPRRRPLPVPLAEWWSRTRTSAPSDYRNHVSRGTMDGSCWFVTVASGGLTRQFFLFGGHQDSEFGNQQLEVLRLIQEHEEWVH